MEIKSIKDYYKKILRFVKENPERVLLFLCAFGLLYSGFLFLLPKQPTYFSVLYLEPDYYGVTYFGSAFARFGIENHESQNNQYNVEFFIDALNDNNIVDSILLAKRQFFVEKDKNFSSFASFPLPEKFAKKSSLRFRIQTSAFDENYSVHFWIKR